MNRSDRLKFMAALMVYEGVLAEHVAVNLAFKIDAEIDQRIKEENLNPKGKQS